MLVFSNSRQYNPPGSDVYYMATVLQVRRMTGCAAEPGRWGPVLGQPVGWETDMEYNVVPEIAAGKVGGGILCTQQSKDAGCSWAQVICCLELHDAYSSRALSSCGA